MAGALGTLNIDLTLNTASFTNAINRSQHQTERFNQNVRVSLQSITVQQERMASQTAKSASSFANFAKVVTGALSVKQVINYADGWTDLQNRLKLVTDSTQALNRATNDVYTIAQKTYQSLDATAQVYQRFSDNAERLGINQQKVAELTETVSKAVSLSGTSAASAAMGLTQFGQALAAGQLRGQDLNSVIEQIPGLAQAIAEGMGISMGDLKKKAQDGEMAIDKIIQALEKVKDSVDQKFATSVTTVSQGFTNLQSAMTKFIGEANQSTGATQLLTTGLSGLSNNLSTVAKIVETVAVTALVAKLSQWTKATYLKNQASANEAKAALRSAEANSFAATSVARKAWADKEAAISAMNSAKMSYQSAKGTAAEAYALEKVIATKSLATAASLQYKQALIAETATQRTLTATRRQATIAGRALSGALAFTGGPVGLALTAIAAVGVGMYEYSENVKQAKLESIEFANALDTSTEALKAMNNQALLTNVSKLSSGIDAEIEKFEESIEKAKKLATDSKSGWSLSATSYLRSTNDYEGYKEIIAEQQREAKIGLDAAMGDVVSQLTALERQRASMRKLLAQVEEKYGKQSDEYQRYISKVEEVDSVVNKFRVTLKNLGFDFEALTGKADEAANSSANIIKGMAKKIEDSIAESQRTIMKAKASPAELAKLNAEDVLKRRQIKPEDNGYEKALAKEIEAQNALLAQRNKPKKSTIDYAKQYTKLLSELQEKQASLIADGQSIQLYGTTSSFNEYSSALADIKKNKEKFDAILKIDPKAIETIKEKAKAIDDMARANSVAQFAYDRNKEVEQMQFETSLIGKSRAEQERLNALREVDLLYKQASVDLGDKELANLQRNVELTKQKIDAELQKRELMKLDPVEGLSQGLSDFSDSATNVMENVKNVTANALNNMSDSLADFVLTGKGSFKDFANAVISDITRMVMKMLVFKAIEAGTSFFMGGASGGGDAGGGPGGLFAYGGYTGHGGKFEPKGVVHGGEFVFTKEATAKLGIGNLYRLMNSTQGYASGGFVGSLAGKVPSTPVTTSSSSGVNITVVNQITVTGNGDAVLAQAMKEAAEQGTEAGAQKARAIILQDFQSNGTARRTLGV
ncbi:phage tail tape measure protein [Proteus mirabilis]|nr:phage tail tape measure protein [Proteus mirabilis]MBG6049685.1 phage tail tape measure protein [Proteus mirabilis]